MGLGHVLYVCVLYDCLFIQFVCLSNLSVNLFICLSFKPLCLIFSVSTCLSIVCVWVYEHMRVCTWQGVVSASLQVEGTQVLGDFAVEGEQSFSYRIHHYTILPVQLSRPTNQSPNLRINPTWGRGFRWESGCHKILLDTGVLQFLTCDKPQEVWDSVHRLVCDEKEWLEWRTILQNIPQYINIHQR